MLSTTRRTSDADAISDTTRPSATSQDAQESPDTLESPNALTLKQAVSYAEVSMSTLNRYIAQAKLRSRKIRGKHYVQREDLDRVFGDATSRRTRARLRKAVPTQTTVEAPRPARTVSAEDEDKLLDEWAERVAAAAPPLTDQQVKVVLAAFATVAPKD
ncbi:hypothetical protein GCM10022383_00030 [Microbacterium soli]|uniref:Helix-turn-helix domain-containing protein n=2 Tax=Microbacterium soli TaxID=446075 RepID=A0ABP7MKW0_9MICO